MRYLALDLETVPDVARGCAVGGFTGAPVEIAAQMRADALEHTKGESDFLPLPYHRIVAVGLVGYNTETRDVVGRAICSEVEPDLIYPADRWLDGMPCMVSWNGRGFDLPLLRLRAMFNKVPVPHIAGRQQDRRWERYDNRFGDVHCDMADVLSGYGGARRPRLKDVAGGMGIPIKTQASSDAIWEEWLVGRTEQIRYHAYEDTVATARIHMAWLWGNGWVPTETYHAMDEKMAALLAPEAAAV